jgi:hypothetical protein
MFDAGDMMLCPATTRSGNMSHQKATPDPNAAQQAPHMQASPEKQHRRLQKLVGQWTCETDESEPEAQKASGTERVRQLGDLRVLAEGEGGSWQQLMVLHYRRTK